MGARTLFNLVGLTACGKKKIGIAIAESINAEIISLDSMKVYRGMDIGTAKPTEEDRSRAVFHMLDILDPKESFSVGAFLETARAQVERIQGRGKEVLFLGGTAFYLNCLLNGLFTAPDSDPLIRDELLREARAMGTAHLHGRLRGADPHSAEKIHKNDIKRLVRALEVIRVTGRPLSWLKRHRTTRIIDNPTRTVGLRWPLAMLEERIRKRTARMFARGLVDEVRAILDGPGFGPESGKAIGYREILSHIEGDLTRREAEEEINRNSLKFVKKQETWYRRFPEIRWFELRSTDDAGRVAEEAAAYFLGESG